jgi:hypothetical protein
MRGIFISVCLFLSLGSFAQLTTSYSMGGISFGNAQHNTFSGPLLLTSDKGCLTITNGVAVYSASAAGSLLFDLDCDNVEDTEVPTFVLFPNPAPGYTRIFSTRTLSSTEAVSLLVHDSKGALLQKMQVAAGQLKGGLSLQTIKWPSGFCTITILYKNRPTTLKLINTTY